MIEYPFLKGHGTENDFVLLPDANGKHELTVGQVALLCHRRAGIGGDGVIRVVRTDATDDPAAVEARGEATWFMDYRNSDGSLSEMCGNGIRVLGHYLATHADVDPRDPLPIATRAGIKTLTFDGDQITVDMGRPEVLGETTVRVGDRDLRATHVSMGNPARGRLRGRPRRGRAAHRGRPVTTTPSTPTGSTWSSSRAAASTTSRCGSTSADRGRRGRAAREPAR